LSQGKPVYMSKTYELEIFHLREKEIPVDKVELRVPNLIQLQWEPTGPRFAYLAQMSSAIATTPGAPTTAESGSGSMKLVVGVQMVKTDRGKVEKLLENDVHKYRINHIAWSPKGQFLLIASLSGTGHIEWWDMHDCVLLSSIDDASYTNLAWDPTGRYLATWVSSLKLKHDIELAMWTCVGRALYKMGGADMKELLTVSWRPRPPSLLSEADVKNVKRNMKKYNQKFEVEDKLLLQAANKEFMDKRRRLKKEYKEVRDRLKGLLDKMEANANEKPPQFQDEEEVEATVNVYEASESTTKA
jgi:translation initiation factor 3 subunit B